jgi:ribonucleoside-diphosphate reductase alpha chain
MNLELYDEWKDTNAVQLAVYFLDGVMQEFIQKTKDYPHLTAAHNFAVRHRALGLGVLGWHSYLQKLGIPFESMDAKLLNVSIFKQLNSQSYNASIELGKELGYAPIFEEISTLDSKRRNTTLLAIAPTTSSSAILGQASPGIEPFSSNYYKAGLAKGNFMRKNKYLEKILIEKEQNNEDTWRSIMINQGSVQHLTFLNEHEKLVFKTFNELSQFDILIQASQRQRYIDQSQSLNLNIPPNLPIKDVNRLLISAWEMDIKTLYYQRSQSVSKEFVTNMINCSSCES